MNKKGAIHVDWAVSMALFVLFIIGILVFLKPGVLSLYDDEYLSTLVASEVLNRSTVSLEEIPITFTPTQSVVMLSFSDPFPLCGDSNPERYVVIKEGQKLPAPADPKNYELSISNSCVSQIKMQVVQERQTIRLVHFALGSWQNGAVACTPPTCESIDGQLRSVGVKETKRGIGDDALASVLFSLQDAAGYDAFKQQINFPARKSFRVCRNVVTEETCSPSVAPPADADITAKTVSNVLLTNTADIEGKVDVIVQVW